MASASYNLIVILGPTASGKTSLAARIAFSLQTEVISADSRQVYRGMDIGTGKDLSEFIVEGNPVPYHMIDIVEPGYEFSVFEFQREFNRCFEDITRRGLVPVMVGGTGLYIEAVLEGYEMAEAPADQVLREKLKGEDMAALQGRLKALNPRLHNTTDLTVRDRIIRAIEIAVHTQAKRTSEPALGKRVPIVPFVIGVRWDRAELRRRIIERLHRRLEAGMVDEVKRLHADGLGWDAMEFYGLEYRYVSRYLRGQMDYTTMKTTLATRIQQYAKRQDTWFRRMERRGWEIHWVENGDYDAAMNLMREHQLIKSGTEYHSRGSRSPD